METKSSSSERKHGDFGRSYARNNVRFFSHTTEIFRHHIPTEFILLGVIESLVLMVSFYIGTAIRVTELVWHEVIGTQFLNALVFGVVMLSSLIAFGAYQRQPKQTRSELVIRLASSLMLGLVVLTLTYYIAPEFFFHGRGSVALAVIVSFVTILAIRLAFMKIMSAYNLHLRVLILGGGKTADLVKQAQAAGDLDGLNIICYMPVPGDHEGNKTISLANTRGALAKYVAEQYIDVIVLAMDDRRKGLPVHDLLECKMGGVEVIDLLTFFERHTGKVRLDIVQPSWIFLSSGFRVSQFKRMWKRVFDVVLVLLLLPIVLPLMLMIVIALLIESRFRASVFYQQTRVGQYGQPFSIYKFRSMITNAEQDGIPLWCQKNDSRITRVGALLRKFRLDEIPQLYNILKGDMSFVGPRPERPEFVQRLEEKIPFYSERHRVKPGLSGWAQIRYSYGASEEDGYEKLQYDLYYVKNYSALLDALIMLQTAEVVLLGRGAH